MPSPQPGARRYPVIGYLFALVGAAALVWFGLGMHRGLLLSNDIKTKIWPFAPYLSPRPLAAPALSDPVWQFVPWIEVARRELLAGRLPLWNPHQDGGVPLLGNSVSALGSPLSWPALVLGVDGGWNLSLLLRVLVALAGTYVWLTERGRSPAAAMLGAAGFALSGPFIAWLEHPHTLAAAPLPFLLFFSGRLVTKPAPGNILGTAAATFLVLAGGHPETALFAALATFGSLLARVPRASRLLPPFGAAALGTALAAPLLLPFLEYFSLSAARHGSDRKPFVLPFEALGRFVLPGDPLSHPIEAAATVSLVVLILVPFGLTRIRQDRETAVWTVIAVGCLLVAYDNPLVRFLARETPVYWTRALIILPLPLVFLASDGLDRLLERAKTAGRGPAARLVAALLVAAAAGELLLSARQVHAIWPAAERTPRTPLLQRLLADEDVFRVLPLHTYLPANLATEIGLDDLRGYDALAVRAWRERRATIGRFTNTPAVVDVIEPWDLAPGGRDLDFWNVKYLLLHPQFAFSAVEMNKSLGLDLEEIASGADGKLLLNRRVLPRVRWMPPAPAQARVEGLDRHPTRWAFDAQASAPGRILVANPFFPGWQVRIDGRRVGLLLRPGDPIEFDVPAGRHRVELSYRPVSFLGGLGLALAAIALLVFWCAHVPRTIR